MGQVYFDNAATTALDDRVKSAMVEAMDAYGNPSSLHSLGRKSKAIIESSRANIGKLFNCLPSEITFTSGGTESDNLAILGTVEIGDIQTIISSRLEHPAIIDSISKAQKLFDVTVRWVNILANGDIDLAHLESLLSESKMALVSLMHINNEIGNVLDIVKVGELCHSYNAIFHTDMVQSVGHLPLDLGSLPVDLISVSAHKIHGPKGSGFLYHKKGTKITAQSNGGSQERDYRGGTENVLGIIGMAKALEISFNEFDAINASLLELKSYFITEISEKLPQVKFNGKTGDLENSSNSIINVNFPSQENNELVLFQFDLNGISVSGGSACSSGSFSGSHVLNQLGIGGASIRFSFSKFNTKKEIDRVLEVLKDIIQ
jgi:cysteine desulfurase